MQRRARQTDATQRFLTNLGHPGEHVLDACASPGDALVAPLLCFRERLSLPPLRWMTMRQPAPVSRASRSPSTLPRLTGQVRAAPVGGSSRIAKNLLFPLDFSLGPGSTPANPKSAPKTQPFGLQF
jgi:hypothetical protein